MRFVALFQMDRNRVVLSANHYWHSLENRRLREGAINESDFAVSSGEWKNLGICGIENDRGCVVFDKTCFNVLPGFHRFCRAILSLHRADLLSNLRLRLVVHKK